MTNLGFGNESAYEWAQKEHVRKTHKIRTACIIGMLLTVGGCTVQLFTHPGGLHYKGDTPEFFVAMMIIVAIIFADMLFERHFRKELDRAKNYSDPASSDFRPTSEADRLLGMATKRKNSNPRPNPYETYLARFNWVQVCGYQKYFYRHYIEYEKIKGVEGQFRRAAETSYMMSHAPTDKRDPIFAGAMANGLFGPVAGVAAYSQAVSDNANAEVEAEFTRQRNRENAKAMTEMGSSVAFIAHQVSAPIDAFTRFHKIQTGSYKRALTFTAIESDNWCKDRSRGILDIDFLAKIDNPPKIDGHPVLHDGSYLVVAKLGQQEIGKGFLIGGCTRSGESSIDLEDNPLDPEQVYQRILSRKKPGSSGLQAITTDSPSMQYAGFWNGRIYDALIMLEDDAPKTFSFSDLSFQIEPLFEWILQL